MKSSADLINEIVAKVHSAVIFDCKLALYDMEQRSTFARDLSQLSLSSLEIIAESICQK